MKGGNFTRQKIIINGREEEKQVGERKMNMEEIEETVVKEMNE